MKINSIEYDGDLYKAIKTKAPVMSSHRGRTWDILDMNAKFYHEYGMFVTRIWADTSWGHYGYFNINAYSTDSKGERLYAEDPNNDYIRSDKRNWKYDNRNLPVDDWYKFKF
jgi:hypothetical protein